MCKGVTVMVVGNGHRDTSSNPQWNFLHFTELIPLQKGMNPIILLPAMDSRADWVL